jgi:hypothetical protein
MSQTLAQGVQAIVSRSAKFGRRFISITVRQARALVLGLREWLHILTVVLCNGNG